MGASVSLEGIEYRVKRLFRLTSYDERQKNEHTNQNESGVGKAIVQSLQVNAVTDLPTTIGVR